MPTITIDKRDLLELLGEPVDDATLKEKIPMIGTELEEFGNEITVEIFPNRPDLLSTQGFGRALKSFLGLEEGLRSYRVRDSQKEIIIKDTVKTVRPYTVCAIVKDMQFDDAKIKEVMQMQEKLHITYGRNRKKVALGVYPMEKIGFPITYEGRKPSEIRFIPLESTEEMDGNEILERSPKGREYGSLLKGKERYPIFIDANDQVLSMPPIINSHTVGKIDDNTEEVFIECSGFDLAYLQKALNIVICNLADMGGTIYSLNLQYGKNTLVTPDLRPATMNLETAYANKILGLQLDKEKMDTLLKRMGFGVEKDTILIPAYRTDILHPIDLVEDIAIAYGFNDFQPEIPEIATIGQENPFKKFVRAVRDLMVGFQLMEIKNYFLTNKEDLFTKMALDEEPVAEMQNALTTEYTVLRPSLVPGLLHVYAKNTHYAYPQNIFEIGEVFTIDDTAVRETTHLSVGICHEQATFTQCKEILSAFFRNLGLAYTLEEEERTCFIAGRSGRILLNECPIGFIGEIHPQVLSNWGIGMPVAAFEIAINKIYETI
jgi:phenylalanyl-tRNA synthetase beta chain